MDKLIAIASLGQKAYSRWLFRRLLSGIIVVAGLTIVTSIMVSAMLIGGLYALYFLLSGYGAEPQAAMIITGIMAGLSIGMLAILTLVGLQHLRQMPRALLKRSPFTSGAMDTLDAFTDGLMADQDKKAS